MINKSKERNSSIELLRIFAIFIIIINHYAGYSGFDLNGNLEWSNIIPTWLHIGGKLGVDIFVFISGYYLCEGNKFKINKLVKLILEVFFYSMILLVIGLLMNNLNLKDAVKLVFAIPSSRWQYITIYVMLYILSPYINIFLDNIKLKSLLKLVLILTFTWVIVPSFFYFGFDISYSIAWFIYIYILAAFIKKIEKKFPVRPKLYVFIGMVSIFIIALSEVIIKYIGFNYINEISRAVEHFRNYNSIFVVSATIFLFLGFKQMNIKYNKMINKIASTSLAVFILHDNVVLRNFLWKDVFKAAHFQQSNLLIFHAICSCLIILFVCSIIDLIRQNLLEKKIMNYLEPKIEKMEDRVDGILDKLL